MVYTKSQNYTNMVVGKYEIRTFKGVVVALLLYSSFDVFCTHKCTSQIVLDKRFVQIYLDVSFKPLIPYPLIEK
jgi:hypothetical protein